MALTLGAFATSPARADINGCPASDFANRQTSNRVGATATPSGNTVNYTFESFITEGSGGVPGLIEYCVYSDTQPDSVTMGTGAIGANGSAWTGTNPPVQNFKNFSFQRPDGDPSNIPYDRASHPMGSLTWNSGVPGNIGSILLHINDPVECSNLYLGNPLTCFVKPGSLAFLPKPPTATKSAYPSYENAFSWTIDKSVDNAMIKTSTAGTFNYTVTVAHDDGSAVGWQVNGTITIANQNPAGDDITGVTVTDAVDNGGTCTVTGDMPVTVPAGGSVTLNYNCTYASAPSPSKGKNTATVTWPEQTWGLPAGSTPATATFDFGAVTPGLFNECVDVSDSGTLGTGPVCVGVGTNPTTFGYSRNVGSHPGTCTEVTNTATFTTTDSKTSGSATANATVCVGADLTVEKTAKTSFKRTYNWDISKSVDKTEIDNSGGDVTFNYTVNVNEKGFTDSYWQVTGTITVTNPNIWEDITGVTVTDAVENGGACTVTGGTNVTVPRGDSVTLDYKCTYASAPSSSSGKNTATATWDAGAFFTPNSSASGSKGFEFTTPTTTVNQTVTVTDSLAGTLGTLTATDSMPFASSAPGYTYSRTVTGTPGTCKTFDNTATIVQTGQFSSQSVKVCVGKDLTVSKTATPSFTRTYNWSITKAVDKTLVEQLGGGTATFNYTVNASETGYTDSAWQVTGTITVTNPNDWEAVTVNVSDAVTNGGSCSVTSGTGVTVPAGGSVTRNYNCTYGSAPSPSSGTNTATATWSATAASTPNGSASGSAGFAFMTPTTTVNKTVTVTDTYNSVTTTLGTLTATDSTPYASAPYTYPHTVNVPTFNCVKYTNTATIVETGQTASQTIEVCGPAQTGALTMGFWQNKNGQGIITGGASTGGVCNSGTWLRQYAPFQDLSATANCSAVATYVTTIIKAANASGASMNAMLKAQDLATSLDVYFSDPALGGNKINAPSPIGGVTIDLTKICKMIDSSGGGSCSSSFENVSAAFGGAIKTVSEMLTYAASRSNAGGSTWYANVKATQQLAKDAFDAINNQVAFSP